MAYYTITYGKSGVILGYLIFRNALYINRLTFITRLLSSLFVPNVKRQELKVHQTPFFILTLNVRKTGAGAIERQGTDNQDREVL